MGPNYTEKLCFSAKKTIKQKDNIQAGEKYLQIMLPTRG